MEIQELRDGYFPISWIAVAALLSSESTVAPRVVVSSCPSVKRSRDAEAPRKLGFQRAKAGQNSEH